MLNDILLIIGGLFLGGGAAFFFLKTRIQQEAKARTIAENELVRLQVILDERSAENNRVSAALAAVTAEKEQMRAEVVSTAIRCASAEEKNNRIPELESEVR